MTVFGILLAVVGYALQYRMNRRAFNRRNAACVVGFNSYEVAAATRLLAGVGRQVGTVCLVVGLLLAAFSFFGHRS